MRNRYDASSKWLIETFAAQLLQIAGVQPGVRVKPVPPELVQSRQLPDGLVEVTFPNTTKPELFLIEINTYSYTETATELLDDICLTYLNRRVVPEVIDITLHDRGNVRVAPEIRVRSPLGLSRIEAGWRVINLWERNASDFFPLRDPGIAPWIPLMKFDEKPEVVLQQYRDVIDQNTTGSQHDNLLGVTQVLASLRWDAALLKKLFSEDGKMIEAPLLQEWLQETEQKTLRRVVVKKLEQRFGSLKPDLAAAIRLVNDQSQLELLLDSAYTCSTLEDFRRVMNLPQSPAN